MILVLSSVLSMLLKADPRNVVKDSPDPLLLWMTLAFLDSVEPSKTFVWKVKGGLQSGR